MQSRNVIGRPAGRQAVGTGWNFFHHKPRADTRCLHVEVKRYTRRGIAASMRLLRTAMERNPWSKGPSIAPRGVQLSRKLELSPDREASDREGDPVAHEPNRPCGDAIRFV